MSYKELADKLEWLAEGYWEAEIRKAIAILRGLDAQEPFGCVTVRRLSQRFTNHHDQYHFYPAGQPPYLDNVDEVYTLYAAPVAAQPLSDEEIAFCIFESKLKNPAITRDGTTSIRIARAAITAFCQKNGIKEQG